MSNLDEYRLKRKPDTGSREDELPTIVSLFDSMSLTGHSLAESGGNDSCETHLTSVYSIEDSAEETVGSTESRRDRVQEIRVRRRTS